MQRSLQEALISARDSSERQHIQLQLQQQLVQASSSMRRRQDEQNQRINQRPNQAAWLSLAAWLLEASSGLAATDRHRCCLSVLSVLRISVLNDKGTGSRPCSSNRSSELWAGCLQQAAVWQQSTPAVVAQHTQQQQPPQKGQASAAQHQRRLQEELVLLPLCTAPGTARCVAVASLSAVSPSMHLSLIHTSQKHSRRRITAIGSCLLAGSVVQLHLHVWS
jgi:hypothetical protein